MIICNNCKKEMRCVKTGATVHYGNGHVYSGDAFQCPSCDVVVTLIDSAPYHDPFYDQMGYFLEMNEED